VDRMRNGTGNSGFDAARCEYTDLVEAGIIDPTKVVRIGLLERRVCGERPVVGGGNADRTARGSEKSRWYGARKARVKRRSLGFQCRLIAMEKPSLQNNTSREPPARQ